MAMLIAAPCRAGLLLALVAQAAASGCGSTDAATGTPPPLILLTGPRGGAYNPLGTALADVYNARIHTTRVIPQTAGGPEGAGANAQAVEHGKADLAFARSDIAYTAFRHGTARDQTPYLHLRSMAVLYTNAVHVLVRRASGIERLEDLHGHRVQTGDEPDGSTLTRMVLEGHGIALSDVHGMPSSRNSWTMLKQGDLDVRIFASAYPLSSIDDVSEASGVKLLAMSPAVVDRLRSRFPFFKPATIPKGTYRGQDRDVETVGIDGLLLCRDTVPEALVYEMTRTLFDALPDLARSQPSARLINVGRAPATPVPLHPGAARYYRERDLFR
jgi:TRAP transporter TAXI family solute receptor